MAVSVRSVLLKSWSRRVALPALFAVSFAATLGVRLKVVLPARADVAPAVAEVPSMQASATTVALLPAPVPASAQPATGNTVLQVAPRAEGVPAAEPPSPSSRMLPPGASYWPPD